MSEFNPYAPPKQETLPDEVVSAKVEAAGAMEHEGFSIVGNDIIIPRNTKLPPICVRTGQPSTTLLWDNVATSLFATKRARVGIYINEQLARRRRRGNVIAAILAAVAVALVIGLGALVAATLELTEFQMRLTIPFLLVIGLPFVPLISRVRKLYDVIEVTSTAARIRLTPQVAMKFEAILAAQAERAATPADGPAT